MSSGLIVACVSSLVHDLRRRAARAVDAKVENGVQRHALPASQKPAEPATHRAAVFRMIRCRL